MNPPVWAIVVAGGRGHRFGSSQSKLLAMLDGRPVLAWSVSALLAVSDIQGLVVVAPPEHHDAYASALADLSMTLPCHWVAGGETRQESVYRGLLALPAATEIVVIHDAARPLIQPRAIQAVLQPVLTGITVGASLGTPLSQTVKQVVPGQTPWVQATLDRQTLWEVHTPQVFQTAVLLKAHQQAGLTDAPDDASLVEQLDPEALAVLMIPDAPSNLKITIPGDLALAEAYRAKQQEHALQS